MRIFRQQLNLLPRQEITLPYPGGILSCAPGRFSNSEIDIWFTVPDKPTSSVPWIVDIAGTGHPLPDDVLAANFIGTCVMPDHLVWHVFAWAAE